jgi:GH35 family endo-1,4-beta-xylanase
MSLVNLSNINQQNATRNVSFDIDKEFTFDASVDFINGFRLVNVENLTDNSDVSSESLTVQLKANDTIIDPSPSNVMGLTLGNTEVGINHSTTTFKLNISGNYDKLFSKDVIEYIKDDELYVLTSDVYDYVEVKGMDNVDADGVYINFEDPLTSTTSTWIGPIGSAGVLGSTNFSHIIADIDNDNTGETIRWILNDDSDGNPSAFTDALPSGTTLQEALNSHGFVSSVGADNATFKFGKTIKGTINDVPLDGSLISFRQEGKSVKTVRYNVEFDLSHDAGLQSTVQATMEHPCDNSSDIFMFQIQQLLNRQPSDEKNTSSLTAGGEKLLGNINTATKNTIKTTETFIEDGEAKFIDYWDTAICGNVCKWRSVNNTQGTFDFSGADVFHSFCKKNGLKMIWHTLLWGANQGYPEWFEGLSVQESRVALNDWFAAVADRYGDDIYGIQVLNEITPGHQDEGTELLRNQLGGAGETGFDWAIYVYERARYHFPNALLWTNDFHLLGTQTKRDYMINFANILKQRNLIDAFGCQSHYFTINDLTKSELTSAIQEITDETSGLPIHITEFDLSGTDKEQLERYQRLFPVIWKHSNVERINLWGYINRENWRYEQGHQTGLINRDGTNKRPALVWLEQYVKTNVSSLLTWSVTSSSENSHHSQSFDPSSVLFNQSGFINSNELTVTEFKHYDYRAKYPDGTAIVGNTFTFYYTLGYEKLLTYIGFSGEEVIDCVIKKRSEVTVDGGFNPSFTTVVGSFDREAQRAYDDGDTQQEYQVTITVKNNNTNNVNISFFTEHD